MRATPIRRVDSRHEALFMVIGANWEKVEGLTRVVAGGDNDRGGVGSIVRLLTGGTVSGWLCKLWRALSLAFSRAFQPSSERWRAVGFQHADAFNAPGIGGKLGAPPWWRDGIHAHAGSRSVSAGRLQPMDKYQSTVAK